MLGITNAYNCIYPFKHTLVHYIHTRAQSNSKISLQYENLTTAGEKEKREGVKTGSMDVKGGGKKEDMKETENWSVAVRELQGEVSHSRSLCSY